MPMLKNPNQQIPQGFTFHEPKTNFCPQPFSSLDSIVQQVIAHRSGRPDLLPMTNWSLDPAVVYNQVYAYNVAKCVQMNWTDYLTGGEQSVPFPRQSPSHFQRVKNLAAGGEVIIEWIKEGSPTVPQEQANKRAEICVACPLNGVGGWETYFTVPVSNAIRREIGKKKEMKLETPFDDGIQVCKACSCPTPLKVWIPIGNIIEKMPQAQKSSLDPKCWITAEEKGLTETKPI